MNVLQTQLRVISALTIREINSQQQNLMYGYAWALVDIALMIGGMLVMKLAIKAFNTPGMPPAVFIISGIIPWYLFQHGYDVPRSAITRNRRLLTFPIVTELDIIVAAEVQLLVLYGIMYVICATIASAIEQSPMPRSPLAIMLLFFASWLLGVFFGLILLPLHRIYAPMNKFLSFFLRLGMFLSGVFLTISFFPGYVWPYLTWNPMLHVEELIKTYWFSTYRTPVGQSMYVVECLLGMAVTGLLCERYVRRRLPEE
jgi:capsular polysaccharide transport system permease protein